MTNVISESRIPKVSFRLLALQLHTPGTLEQSSRTIDEQDAAQRTQHLLSRYVRMNLELYSRPHQRLVLNPVRLIRIGALPLLQILDVRLVIPFKPDNLRLSFKRKHVRSNPIEKPPIV